MENHTRTNGEVYDYFTCELNKITTKNIKILEERKRIGHIDQKEYDTEREKMNQTISTAKTNFRFGYNNWIY